MVGKDGAGLSSVEPLPLSHDCIALERVIRTDANYTQVTALRS